MRIAVCDDEKDQVQINVQLIQKWADAAKILVTVDPYSSAEGLSFCLSDVRPYDLAILDIKMRNMSGMDLAKLIRRNDKNIQFIFITGLEEHTIEGYDVSALKYIIKPFKPEKLFEALNQAYLLYKQNDTGSLIVKHDGVLQSIPFDEIMYMEKHLHDFDIYTVTMGQFRTRKNMDNMISALDKQIFIRCHRSTIINIAHVTGLLRDAVKLKYTDETIIVSQTYIQEVTKLFIKYHSNKNDFWKGSGM